MGSGINGAPTTPSNSWISAFRPPNNDVIEVTCDDLSFDLTQDFMACHEMA